MQQSIPEGKPTEEAQGTSQTHLVNYLLFLWPARFENKSPSSLPSRGPEKPLGGFTFSRRMSAKSFKQAFSSGCLLFCARHVTAQYIMPSACSLSQLVCPACINLGIQRSTMRSNQCIHNLEFCRRATQKILKMRTCAVLFSRPFSGHQFDPQITGPPQ